MKKLMMSATCVLFVSAPMGHAQLLPDLEIPTNQPPKVEAAPAEIAPQGQVEKSKSFVSEFCSYTLFSDASDVLDFRGSSIEPCFDTGRGRDILTLNPSDYPDGVFVISDRGTSVLEIPVGPSVVFDQESTAELIATGPQDDTIRMGLGYAPKGLPITMPSTSIYPGDGDDLVVIGSGKRPTDAPRNVSSSRIFPQGSSLSLEAGCGRMNDPQSIDATMDGATKTRIKIDSSGCGLALVRHSAPSEIKMKGGRFVAVLENDEQGLIEPFSARIEQSSGLSFSAINPHKNSVLDWDGMGSATLKITTNHPDAGGMYAAKVDGRIYADIEKGEGDMSVDLASTSLLELSFNNKADMNATLLAPQIDVHWNMGEDSTPPNLSIPSVKAIFRHQPKNPLVPDQLSLDEAEQQLPLEEETPKVRDGVGMTQLGRTAMIEGRPVKGDEKPDASAIDYWSWAGGLVDIEPQQLNLYLQSSNPCLSVALDEKAASCPGNDGLDLGDAKMMTIVFTDKTLSWDLSKTLSVPARSVFLSAFGRRGE